MTRNSFRNNYLNYKLLFSEVTLWILVLIGIPAFLYSLYGFGIKVHFDEWVGRGLYPGLALANGADLYEPQRGPHITLYGAGSALFYSPTALSSSPQGAIWFGYCLNILGLIFSVGYLLYQVLSSVYKQLNKRILATMGCLIIVSSIFVIEPTTEGVFRIHADFPAFFFLITGLCFFQAYIKNNSNLLLWFTCIFLCLSVWAKLPTLPAIVFPSVYFILQKKFKEAVLFIPRLLVAFSLISFSFFWLYGFDDTMFILFKHVQKANMWGIRNTLFHGNNTWIGMGYIEAMPLLFRYLIMYLAEYWYIILISVVSSVAAYRFRKNIPQTSILINLSIIYFLTLPPCLAALAHYGSVENALLFANTSGVLIFLFSLLILTSSKVPSNLFILFLWTFAIFFVLPFIRLAKSSPNDIEEAPQQQAFRYLQSGKKDVYFGWYPISHLMHSGVALTSIEAPIHLSETLPDDFNFSTKDIPSEARYLATGPTGYGSHMLQYYIGKLTEKPPPPELSNWRLYQITDLIHETDE